MKRLTFVWIAAAAVWGCAKPADQAKPLVSEVTPVSFNATGAPTIEFSAPDMMCPDGCGAKVKEILSEQPGAKEVLVDFDAKKAIVAIEGEGSFDANAAVAALVDHGFKNSSIKGNAVEAASIPKPQVPSDGAVQ